MEKRKLYKKKGDKLDELSIEEGLIEKFDILAFYFGAKYCSSCVKFTPILKDFYENLKAKNESFELLYVSSDKTKEEMKEFVLGSHGDWFVRWLDESDEYGENFEFMWDFREALNITGIPTLFVAKNNSEDLASAKGITDVLSKGLHAFEEWKNNPAIDPEEGYEEEKGEFFKESGIKPKCCKISKYKPLGSTSPAELLAGNILLKRDENGFKEEAAERAISDFELVGFYFSASWCPPCHTFTLKLKQVYDELKSEKQSFEIVFISSDNSEEEMKKYMQEFHGNWYAVSYDAKIKKVLSEKFKVEGIPTLGIVNKKGDLVVPDACSDVMIKETVAFNFWMEGNQATTIDEQNFYWNTIGEEEQEEEKEAVEEQKTEDGKTEK